MRRLILSAVCTTLVATALIAAPGAPAASTLVVNRAPSSTLSGAKTHLTGGRDLVYAKGHLYTLDDDTVRVFAAGAKGNAAPQRSIDVDVPAGQHGLALAVDPDGYTYVITSNDSLTSSTIFVYDPTASGAAGYTSYTNGFLGVLSPIDITDHGGGVAVLDNTSNAIYFYDFRDSPAVTGGIDAGSGTQTKIFSPTTIDGAPNGRLVVRGPDWVSVFAADADGDVAPKQYVQGAKTLLGVPLGAGLDRNGNLLVATADDYTGAASASPRVLSFAPKATGNVAPRAVLAGTRADLTVPYVEVAPDGTLAIANFDPLTLTFDDTIGFYRSLGPYAAPAKPGSLKASGTAAAARHTLTWKAARTNPDTPVTGYRVKVVCAQAVVLDTLLPAKARKVVARSGTVRKGSCTATVKARNRLGYGPAAKVTFKVDRTR